MSDDRADEIAREIVRGQFGFLALESPDPEYRKKDEMDYFRCERDHGIATNLVAAFAAALRAYGRECKDSGIELAAGYIEEKDGYWQDGIRALKSKPEAQDTP